jgi:LmbE family N-acetylglucosaminyl deacetylase
MNIANGSCGTVEELPEAIIAKRRAEAMDACRLIDATFHESICNDLEVFHTYEMIAKVIYVVRQVRPRIMLVQSPQDYMEEHQNASRIGVTAAFCRGMLNYASDPPADPVMDDVTVYHAMPYGLRDPMRGRIRPGQYVDITSVMEEKRAMLACHRSQKEWLDRSQGLNAYLDTMEGFAKEVGSMSGRFQYAEGWRRRAHLGLSAEDTDLLSEVLGDKCMIDEEYERALDE